MKKTCIICLFLLLALGFTGLSSAGWSDRVKFSLKAETGTLEVGVRSAEAGEQDSESANRISYREEKRKFDIDGKDYAKSVHFDVRGRSSYSPQCVLEIANGGTLPAVIDELELKKSPHLALKRWTVDFPGGYQDKGTGLATLQKAIKDAPLDPGQTMQVALQFKFKKEKGKDKAETGEIAGEEAEEEEKEREAGGEISVSYHRWNEMRR